MAGRERSKGGCWTCKLRKKKCDERRPSCATCLSLDIPCHGYGSKPAWMDGGAAEKEKIETLRQRVKEITNHKRRLRVRQNVSQSPNIGNQGNDHAIITPVSMDDMYPTPQPSHAYATNLGNSRIEGRSLRQPENSIGLTGVDIDLVQQRPTSSNSDSGQIEIYRQTPILPEEEAGRLLHYLDYVFTIQFPFYKPSASNGGRGWLLAILLQLDPLYHAALSIATYHEHFEALVIQHSLSVESFNDVRELPLCCKLEEQLMEHNISLSRIRNLLRRLEDLGGSQSELKLAEYVELIACMAILISLEVLKGDSDSWQVHLTAASSILPLAHKAFRSDQANSLSSTYKGAFRFFSAALTWYSLQASVTGGALMSGDSEHIELTSLYVPISDFAGCATWVIQELVNIMRLARWKDTMKSKKQLSMRELTTRALQIETSLKSELSMVSKKIDQSSLVDYFHNPSDYIQLLVTRIFGYSTLIYLYMTESGPCPDVSEIHTNVSKTIEAFKALPQAELVRSLSLPFCIAGSVATGDQELAFLEIATRAKINLCHFGSSRHALKIIQECWRMRKSEEVEDGNVDWRVAMRNLGLNILLV